MGNTIQTAPFVVATGDANVQHVAVGMPGYDFAKEREQALRSGATVRERGGRSVWREVRAIVDTTKQGAAQYQWDKTGERVRAERIECSLVDGEITCRVLGKCWTKDF